MSDVRLEWISKRAYAIWEEAGRPHGQDAEHWEQAARERDEFERVALAEDPKPASAKKPLIEISKKAQTKKSEAKPKKKADAGAEKPVAAKAVAKAKSAKGAANSKPI
ncbi:putative membrane protein [Shinella sp. BE166]|uniref:DUF2934 domain-containing protein n=1 Tax=Shinella lacus TaxID=2654216 RepID=A0ABT1R677_9HYPH|nr:DUF2934 domain-containing protein [Shinella lacus]MCQ4630559.1 DUF2934 domain-containing protein [Shinella lacus]